MPLVRNVVPGGPPQDPREGREGPLLVLLGDLPGGASGRGGTSASASAAHAHAHAPVEAPVEAEARSEPTEDVRAGTPWADPAPPAAPEPVVDQAPHFEAAPAEEAPRFEAAPAEEATIRGAPEEAPPEEPRRDSFLDWRTAEPEAAAESTRDLSTTMEEAAEAAADDLSTTMDDTADATTEAFSATTEAASDPAGGLSDVASGSVDDWVMETEEDLEPSGLDIERMDTVQSSAEGIRDEVTLTDLPSDFETGGPPVREAAPEESAPAPLEEETTLPASFHQPADTFATSRPEAPPAPPPAPASPPEPFVPMTPVTPEPPPVESTSGVGAFTFGKRDPKDKARRLARVLVSDMIMYNPERHERALANGTLKQDFEDEIRKSWKEYVEQVGEEMAQGNPFWADALNDVLAKGEKMF